MAWPLCIIIWDILIPSIHCQLSLRYKALSFISYIIWMNPQKLKYPNVILNCIHSLNEKSLNTITGVNVFKTVKDWMSVKYLNCNILRQLTIQKGPHHIWMYFSCISVLVRQSYFHERKHNKHYVSYVISCKCDSSWRWSKTFSWRGYINIWYLVYKAEVGYIHWTYTNTFTCSFSLSRNRI